MAQDLIDARIKITPRTQAVLEAMNRVSGRDKSDIAREVLDKWAEEQIHTATLIQRLVKHEGVSGE